MAALKSVREVAMAVPTAVGEAPMEHFARVTDAAMGVLSPAGEAAKRPLDLAAGALYPGLVISYEGKSASKVLKFCILIQQGEGNGSLTACQRPYPFGAGS